MNFHLNFDLLQNKLTTNIKRKKERKREGKSV